MEQLDTFPDGSITVDAARDAYFTHADAALYALAHNIGSDRDRDRLARLLESGPTSNADRIKLISAEFDLVKQNINVWDLEYSWTRAPRIVTLFPDILDVSTTRFLAAANQCRRLPQEKRAPLGHQPDAAFELAHGYAIKCRSFYEALEAAECLELARISFCEFLDEVGEVIDWSIPPAPAHVEHIANRTDRLIPHQRELAKSDRLYRGRRLGGDPAAFREVDRINASCTQAPLN